MLAFSAGQRQAVKSMGATRFVIIVFDTPGG